MKRALIILILTLIGLSVNYCSPPEEEKEAEKIKVGLNLELSGDTATFGQSTRNGITLAVGEINAAGGVLGKEILIISEDNKGDNTEANNAAKKLIEVDKVDAILGSVASSNSIAGGNVADELGVPMITPASTNVKVTEKEIEGKPAVKKYVFRTCFTDDFQGETIARYARLDLKANRIGILFDIKQDYSKGLKDSVAKTFEELGGVPKPVESYQGGDPDFKAQLTKIKAAKVDALILTGYYTEVAQIARQARAIGLNVPIVGGDGFDSPKLIEIGGSAVEGIFFTNHYSQENQAKNVQEFVRKYKAKYNGEVPDSMAALGYDAIYVLADALKRAGSVDKEAVTKAIGETKGYLGVTGTITIDDKHNTIKDIVVLTVKGGQFRLAKTMKPFKVQEQVAEPTGEPKNEG